MSAGTPRSPTSIRSRGKRLKVIGNALADRLLIHRDRVVGAVAIIGGRQLTIHAGLVAVCAGVYGSPAILLRSAIGDPADLTGIGIRPVHALPGVGRNLHDHPALELRLAGTPELERRSRAFAARAFHPEEQLIAKIRSSRCPAGFDLHIYTQGGTRRQQPGRWIWAYTATVLTPKSRGSLRLRSPDPDAAPIIDHVFLTDPMARMSPGSLRASRVRVRSPGSQNSPPSSARRPRRVTRPVPPATSKPG
jgi:choline dehydrogenase